MIRLIRQIRPIGLIVALLLCGCGVPSEARKTAASNAALQRRFVELVEMGQVTRDALEANARANARNWEAFDRLLNPPSVVPSFSPTCQTGPTGQTGTAR